MQTDEQPEYIQTSARDISEAVTKKEEEKRNTFLFVAYVCGYVSGKCCVPLAAQVRQESYPPAPA